MKITAVGIDGKKHISDHGVDERGKLVVRKQLKRADLTKCFANLRPA